MRLTRSGNRSVHFRRYLNHAEAGVRGRDLSGPAENAGSEARKRNLKALPSYPHGFPESSATASMEAGRTAVLRVKRKRSAEAVEALVLSCKRLRRGGVESVARKTPPEDVERGPENNVFQLVATVRSQVLGGMEPMSEGDLRAQMGGNCIPDPLTSRLLTPAALPYHFPGGASPGARSSRPAPFPGQPAAYPPRTPRFGSGDPTGGPLQGDF